MLVGIAPKVVGTIAVAFELSNASNSARSWAYLSAMLGVPPPVGTLSGSTVGCVELSSSNSLELLSSTGHVCVVTKLIVGRTA